LWCFGGACNAIQWPNLPLYCILRCIVVYLFLMRWRVVVDDGRFVASDHFFFFLLFSLFQRWCMFVLVSLDLSILVLIFLLFILVLGSIIKVLNVFNLVLELQFFIYCFFQFNPYLFMFLLSCIDFNKQIQYTQISKYLILHDQIY